MAKKIAVAMREAAQWARSNGRAINLTATGVQYGADNSFESTDTIVMRIAQQRTIVLCHATARSIVMGRGLRLFVCMSARITRKPHDCNFAKFFMRAAYDPGLVVFWRRCDMLCTSGFVDDDMFS